jgi:hypothetical protein
MGFFVYCHFLSQITHQCQNYSLILESNPSRIKDFGATPQGVQMLGQGLDQTLVGGLLSNPTEITQP